MADNPLAFGNIASTLCNPPNGLDFVSSANQIHLFKLSTQLKHMGVRFDQSWNHRGASKVNSPGVRALEFTDFSGIAQGKNSAVGDSQSACIAAFGIWAVAQTIDLAICENKRRSTWCFA